MNETDLTAIRAQAMKYHGEDAKWHFHILSPVCAFNDYPRYAFILEGPDPEETLVCYSDRAEKELGQELSPLLHGAKVLDKDSTGKGYQPSETILRMARRAKSLNEKHIEWHHHVLYPGCRFNAHSPKFALLLEDPETHESLVSLSDEEPTDDLKQIEGQFYGK